MIMKNKLLFTMPTVIALDVSLSMCRTIAHSQPANTPEEELPTRKKLAAEVINQFLDHVSAHCKLEFVAMLTFSHLYEVLSSFTRDLGTIRTHLNSLYEYDKTNFEAVLSGITTLVIDAWGNTVPVQILLVTDGSAGFGPGCLRETIQKAKPFPFPAKMNILSLSDPDDRNYTENCSMLTKFIEVTCGDGMVYFPENHLTSKGCSSAVAKLCAKDFTPYKGLLRCGQLTSKVTLCPPPQPFVSRFDEKRYDISDVVEILGFIDSNDLASPPAHSRHLLLPLKSITNSVYNPSKSEDHEDDIDSGIPNFCVLLHGALKVESLCALCEVGPDWYGFIYSWADNKKKSNLMLSILPPGSDVAPWLGNMLQLGPKEEFVSRKSVQGSSSSAAPTFPVKAAEKKSYGSNFTVWITSTGINNDMQKLLRHARKLPDKTPQFYKELNRMRRWALTIGFEDILESIAQILERESLVSTASHPTAAIQLTHAISQLRKPTALEYDKIIAPHKGS